MVGPGRGGAVIAVASVPGTCGELFQGALDGAPCLVSCPISVGTTARAGVGVAPGPLPAKTRRALAALGIAPSALPPVRLASRLPAGRGYGTSTADLGAALHAASGALGRPVRDDEAVRIAVGVEPTDSTLLPGLALLDHRAGRFHRRLGEPPEATVLVLDPGGRVDTVAFNAHDWGAALARLAGAHRDAFDLLEQGIRDGDLAAVGRAATMSALAHQAILPSPLLDRAAALARAVGAAGVCRAHSGTVVGVLLPPGPPGDEPAARLVAALPPGIATRRLDLVAGGPRLATAATGLREARGDADAAGAAEEVA